MTGPYQIEEADLDHYETLEENDVGRWYILINGSIQFVEDRQAGLNLIESLKREPQQSALAYD